MTRYNSFEKFTIASKPVVASYIHSGVFVPVLNLEAGKERFSFSPFGNSAVRLQYWDENAYASEFQAAVPEVPLPPRNESHVKSAADEAVLAARKEGLVATGDDVEAKSKKRKTEAKDSSKIKKVCR